MELRGIQHIVVSGIAQRTGARDKASFFGKGRRMPDLDSNSLAEDNGPWVNPLETDLARDKDLMMEQILENINHTPLGQVLKKIASLPEVRQQKVLRLRRQITAGRYDLTERLDEVLDKVIEDLIT
jgi:hypothetical protein